MVKYMTSGSEIAIINANKDSLLRSIATYTKIKLQDRDWVEVYLNGEEITILVKSNTIPFIDEVYEIKYYFNRSDFRSNEDLFFWLERSNIECLRFYIYGAGNTGNLYNIIQLSNNRNLLEIKRNEGSGEFEDEWDMVEMGVYSGIMSVPYEELTKIMQGIIKLRSEVNGYDYSGNINLELTKAATGLMVSYRYSNRYFTMKLNRRWEIENFSGSLPENLEGKNALLFIDYIKEFCDYIVYNEKNINRLRVSYGGEKWDRNICVSESNVFLDAYNSICLDVY